MKTLGFGPRTYLVTEYLALIFPEMAPFALTRLKSQTSAVMCNPEAVSVSDDPIMIHNQSQRGCRKRSNMHAAASCIDGSRVACWLLLPWAPSLPSGPRTSWRTPQDMRSAAAISQASSSDVLSFDRTPISSMDQVFWPFPFKYSNREWLRQLQGSGAGAVRGTLEICTKTNSRKGLLRFLPPMPMPMPMPAHYPVPHSASALAAST